MGLSHPKAGLLPSILTSPCVYSKMFNLSNLSVVFAHNLLETYSTGREKNKTIN